MSPEESEVIRLTYAAIDRPEGWYDVLCGLGHVSGACSGLIASIDLRHEKFIGFMQFGLERGFLSEPEDINSLVENWLREASSQNSGSRAFQLVMPPPGPQGKPFNVSSAVGGRLYTRGGEVLTKIVLMRSPEFPPFDTQVLEQINLFLPYLVEAHQVSFNHHERLTENWLHQSLSEYTHDAILLLDDSQCAVLKNKPAAQLLDSGGLAFAEEGKKFHFFNQGYQSLFESAFDELQRNEDPCIKENGLHFYLDWEHLKYRAVVEPWFCRQMSPLGEITKPGAMLMLQLCATQLAITPRDVVQSFPLSRAEADVCCKVCNGYSTEEITRMRHTSLGTTRQQVKACLAKTESDNKSEMIGKVLRALLIA